MRFIQRPKKRMSTGVVVLLVALAGCSDGRAREASQQTGVAKRGATVDDRGQDHAGSSVAETSTATTPQAPSELPPWDPDSPVEPSYRSPLARMRGTVDEVRARARVAELNRQQVVATCMRDHGWQYEPVLANPARSAQSTPVGLSRRQYATEYGFGVSTGLVGSSPGAIPAQTDPNAGYVAALTEEERGRYQHDLLGEPGTSADQATLGCGDRALRSGSVATEDDRAVAEMGRKIQDLQDRIGSSAEVQRATARYADCMAQAGYPGVIDRDGITTDLTDRAIRAMNHPADAEFPQLGTIGPVTYNISALNAVREYERHMAIADLDCSIDLIRTGVTVTETLESQFIANNLGDLERFIATTG